MVGVGVCSSPEFIVAIASSCHEAELLQQYLLGTLPDAQAAELEKHLLTCDSCTQVLDRLAERDPLLQRFQAQATPVELFDATMERLMERLTNAAQDQMPGVSNAIGAEGTLGDFRLIREIGRGGMGIVYEAEQISLNRRVALKILPFAAALDAKQLQRFKNESHAAAHLQHQNIVPVHFVGCERGVHFYAMQFVEGQTLAALIQEARQRESPDKRRSKIENRGSKANGGPVDLLRTGTLTPELESPERSEGVEGESKGVQSTIPDQRPSAETLSPQARSSLSASLSLSFFHTAANLGIQAAEALEHAHQLGVIHRDVKPANLMVDFRGNLWITDFGLAHCQGGCELTMSGDLLGTLRYMSPEQALAKRVIVDERTDIYSLGVTLYELLTLEPALPGTDRQEVLRQIAFEEPKSPRRITPTLPVELETILLKAMAKNPEERYASAREMADDLTRYLKDEPIKATRPTFVERLAKWGRRHKAIVRLAAIFVFLATAGLAISTVLIAQQRDLARQATRNEADKAREAQEKGAEAEKERKRAETNLKQTRAAVDRFFTRAAEEMADKPHMEKVRGALLRDALNFYQGFLEQKGTDPLIKHETARAYLRVAQIQGWLGNVTQVEDPARSAIDLFKELSDQHSASKEYRQDLAEAQSALAVGLDTLLHNDEGLVESGKALTIWEKLVADFPAVPEYRRRVGAAHGDLGLRLWKLERFAEAEKEYRRAQTLLAEIRRDFPSEPEDRQGIGSIQTGLSNMLFEENRWQEAEEILRQKRQKTDLSFWDRDLLAKILARTGKPMEAERIARQMVSEMEKNVNDFPELINYRRNLLGARANLAVALFALKRTKDAEEELERLRDFLKDMLARHPDDVRHSNNLAITSFNLGCLRQGTNRPLEAAENFRESWALYDKTLAKQPDIHNFQSNFACQLSSCPAPQFRDTVRAVQLAKKALQSRPSSWNDWGVLGSALYRAGQWTEAIEALQKAIAMGNGGERYNWLFLAMAHWQRGNPKEARKSYDKAAMAIDHEPFMDELLQAEAAALMGVAPHTKPKEKEEPKGKK
jgi:serine/threonine protein kinase/predicted Zn-dependent protease